MTRLNTRDSIRATDRKLPPMIARRTTGLFSRLMGFAVGPYRRVFASRLRGGDGGIRVWLGFNWFRRTPRGDKIEVGVGTRLALQRQVGLMAGRQYATEFTNHWIGQWNKQKSNGRLRWR